MKMRTLAGRVAATLALSAALLVAGCDGPSDADFLRFTGFHTAGSPDTPPLASAEVDGTDGTSYTVDATFENVSEIVGASSGGTGIRVYSAQVAYQIEGLNPPSYSYTTDLYVPADAGSAAKVSTAAPAATRVASFAARAVTASSNGTGTIPALPLVPAALKEWLVNHDALDSSRAELSVVATFYARTDEGREVRAQGKLRIVLTRGPAGALPVVTVSATSPSASGGSPGEFTVYRDEQGTAALTVTYSVAGDESSFGSLPGAVTIPAAATSATIKVNLRDKAGNGDAVTITLEDGSGYTVGSSSSATVTAVVTPSPSKPTVTISADKSTAAGSEVVTFTVYRSNTAASVLAVSYTVSGDSSFVAAASSSVSIPANMNSATFTVTTKSTPVSGASMTVSLGSGSGYKLGSPSAVTVNEALPSVTISATVPNATPSSAGEFTVYRSNLNTSSLSVGYTVSGDTSSFAALSGTVTIPANASSTTITVATASGVSDGDAITVTLNSGSGYKIGSPSSARVTASLPVALPVVTITASDSIAIDSTDDPGRFKVSRTVNTAAPLYVDYQVNGTATPGIGFDYVALSGTVLIPAGESFASILVDPNQDGTIEGDQTVIVTLKSASDYQLGSPFSAIVTIKDTP